MNQLFEQGQVIDVNGTQLECTAVSVMGNSDNETPKLTYEFRSKSELDSERQAVAQAIADEEAKAEADRLAAEQSTAAPTDTAATDTPAQPTQPTEETQYVK
jgi:hypothetical protein